MRTTVDIDGPILRELKRLQKQEGKTLGRLVSDLLAIAIAQGKTKGTATREVRWISKSMDARVDLADRDAILTAMELAVAEPREKKGSKR
jgi:hypothetical protein